ncbi:probable membrane metalloprotease ARASP2, chloroplastic [Macadamia integrifolia]|uniref:probable membrane metalloprotease ARASP2, chloroplastic n=1 Tax=Macadamia integrifolia TaxID=60698 RepID=UPI001C52A273|nr:probable membrane metalloprotease ARASP2, chloroplastic [Macadamia integrifolia]
MIINLSISPPTSSAYSLLHSKLPISRFPLKPKTQFTNSLISSSSSLCSSFSSPIHQFSRENTRYPYEKRNSLRVWAFSGFELESAQSVVEAVAVLAAIIIVHESGHFLAAYLQGIHVSKFAIGFGPVLAKFNSKNVEYSIRAFPLGGFVGFPDNDPDSDIPVDDENLLKNRPIFDRVLVISAGVIANVIFAYAIVFIQVLSVGLPVQESLPGVIVPEVRAYSAAARDGLLPGDVILSVNGIELPRSFTSVSQVVDIVKKSPGRNVSLTVVRGQQDLEIGVTPDESSDGTGKIGVQLSPNLKISKIRPKNFPEALNLTGREFWGLSSNVIDSIKQTFLNFSQTAGKVSGPVAIIAVGAEVARSNIDGLYQFAALLNLNLAIINLLPLPALDGGSLALILIEAARGGRKLPQELEQGIMSSGIMAVLLLGLFLIVRDTLNLDFIKALL